MNQVRKRKRERGGRERERERERERNEDEKLDERKRVKSRVRNGEHEWKSLEERGDVSCRAQFGARYCSGMQPSYPSPPKQLPMFTLHA